MRREVVPAILAKSAKEFRSRLRAIERVTPLVHIDVMDGKFVPNRTWADPLVVSRLRTSAQFEIHLMVEEPFREVILWGKLASVRRIIVHAESTTLLRELLRSIRATGKEIGLAVNPSTPLRTIIPFLSGVDSDVDFVLVMANEPGFSGKPFRRATLRRIAAIRKRFPELRIGVDIGVNMKTAPLLRAAGATDIAAASSVLGQPDPVAAYRALVRVFAAEPS